MKTTYEKYCDLGIDGSLISLEIAQDVFPHFCYPANAKAIGTEGSILYCFIESYGDMVFACNPESCADTYVYPLARTFDDFIALILSCGSANPVDQIVWMRKEHFSQHLDEENAIRTEQQCEVLQQIQEQLGILPMSDPYDYVKRLQSEFDDSRIEFSDEYYDVLGIER